MKKKYIVAEICKTWNAVSDDGKPLLNQQFEKVIETNLQRGYVLDDWKLASLHYDWIDLNGEATGYVQETIIAIFKIKE